MVGWWCQHLHLFKKWFTRVINLTLRSPSCTRPRLQRRQPVCVGRQQPAQGIGGQQPRVHSQPVAAGLQ